MAGVSSDRLSSALALMSDATLLLAEEGTVLAANDLALEMFGHPAEAILGRPVQPLLPLGDAFASAAEPVSRRLKLQGRRANGVPFPVEASVRVVEVGEERRVLCAVRELGYGALVTEAQRYFDVAFDEAPIGMALFNSDGEYMRVNSSLCRLLGRSEQELIGLRDQELTHPDDRQADLDAAWEILEGRLSTHECEKRFVRPDGSIAWVLASLTFLRDDAGRPLSWVGQFQDISARRAAEEALRASEERHRLVVRNLPGAGVVLYDRELRCVLIEGRHMEDTGYFAAELVGRPMAEIIGPDLLALLEPAARRALVGEASELEALSDRSGRILAIEVAPHRDERGEIAGVLVVVRDFTAQRAAERARREAERRFEVAFARAPIGMVIVGLGGRFERTNDALHRITGYSHEQLAAQEPFAIVDPRDLETVRTTFARFAGGDENLQVEHRFVHADGARIWVRVEATLIRDEDGAPIHALAQVQDVTERRRHESELRHMADHDSLTGLLNRRAFRTALEQHLARARRYGARGALLMLDLDGFKAVNDTEGHSAGDELIAACATALRARLRDSDVIARLGGDEFAVLLPYGGRDDAEVVAASLVNVVRERPGGLTASIGIAVTDEPELGAEAILADADRAMYGAKRAGGDSFAVAPPAPGAT